MPKNTDPPEYTSREITHHVVEVFKARLNSSTDFGFRCLCGHKGGVLFTDRQAASNPPLSQPSTICDRVIAAWRAHTKDLDGVHPNAEDQIRDFFLRQQPGGPKPMNRPQTAISLNTPKPKSLTISAFVDDTLRRIIVDYAEKLGIAVVPVESPHFDWLVTDRYTALKSATALAMREYLARLLYGDEGLVANLTADEKKFRDESVSTEPPTTSPNNVNNLVEKPLRGELKTMTYAQIIRDLDEVDAEDLPYKLPNVEPPTPPTNTNNLPTRIVLRSYAADAKPRIERLLGLARQLQIPVQLAGPWSCTAFPPGEEAHPALDVVFPEVLVHPRDVLIVSDGRESLTEAENQLLWATHEEDQRFTTSLIELLGLHKEASRDDIAEAVERSETSYEALRVEDVQLQEVLKATSGEEAVAAAKRVMGQFIEWRTSVLTALDLPPETSINQVVEKIEEQAGHVAGWRASSISAKNALAAERMATAENQRKLLDIFKAGTVEPSWDRVISCAEARVTNAKQFEKDIKAALGVTDGSRFDIVKMVAVAEALSYRSDDYCALLQQVQQLVKVKQDIALSLGLHANAGIDTMTAHANQLRDGMALQVKRLAAALVYADSDFNRLVEMARRAAEDSAELKKLKQDVNAAAGLHPNTSSDLTLQRVKWLEEVAQGQANAQYQATELAATLGFRPFDRQWNDFPALLTHTQRLVSEHQTLLGQRITDDATIGGLRTALERIEKDCAKFRAFVDEVGPERDSLKEKAAELTEKLDSIHLAITQHLDLDAKSIWPVILGRIVMIRDAARDAKDAIETAVTAERQTIAQRLDFRLGMKSDSTENRTDLDAMLRAVGNLRECRDNLRNQNAGLRRDVDLVGTILTEIAITLDAPPSEALPVGADKEGRPEPNRALPNRILNYYKRLYEAAGFTEPPVGGWEQLTTAIADSIL